MPQLPTPSPAARALCGRRVQCTRNTEVASAHVANMIVVTPEEFVQQQN